MLLKDRANISSKDYKIDKEHYNHGVMKSCTFYDRKTGHAVLHQIFYSDGLLSREVLYKNNNEAVIHNYTDSSIISEIVIHHTSNPNLLKLHGVTSIAAKYDSKGNVIDMEYKTGSTVCDIRFHNTADNCISQIYILSSQPENYNKLIGEYYVYDVKKNKSIRGFHSTEKNNNIKIESVETQQTLLDPKYLEKLAYWALKHDGIDTDCKIKYKLIEEFLPKARSYFLE